MNNEEFKFCYDEACREVDGEIDGMKERFTRMEAFKRVLHAARDEHSMVDDLKDDLEQKQAEIDDLSDQLEQKVKEMDDMRRQYQAEIDDLQKQLLESKNQHLESEKKHLKAEVKAKPMEIHNHFEPGSSSQVFNDKVNGKFMNKKDKKEKKKRWKKIVRNVL